MSTTRQQLNEISRRNFIIYELRESGLTLSKIGEKFNITHERVRQIHRRQWRILKYHLEEDWKDLDARIVNALKKGGINSLEEAKKLSIEELEKIRNIGRKTAILIKGG